MPWREGMVDEVRQRVSLENGTVNVGQKPLKLGIFWTDGIVDPHPPIRRGLEMLVQAAERAGHKVCCFKADIKGHDEDG